MSEQYDPKEWTELMRQLTPQQLRNAMKQAIRREAKAATSIAQSRLMSTGPSVMGNKRDWKKGIRPHVYSRGGGFMVTVKARSNKSGKEAGMHENHRGLKKPILMWMEDGTKRRATRGESSRGGVKRRKKPHDTGQLYAYHILQNSENAMAQNTERNLAKDVEQAVEKVAKKAGFF